MIVLAGADVVLPDRLLAPATLVIDGDRIVDITPGTPPRRGEEVHLDLSNHYLLPGFIDVHVHGLDGMDTQDGDAAIHRIAARLPRFGVTAFCPTSIACSPDALRRMLADVRDARRLPRPGAARVLPAHLESNFINPEFNGAQPLECLRRPPSTSRAYAREGDPGAFTGEEILQEIAAARSEVGIITVAPELDGALDLIRDLAAHGHHLSLGHSGASYEEGLAGIEAGARQATHLFNRMPPLGHRRPGLAGAVLAHEDVTAEIICDGAHVHPAMVRLAVAAKRPSRIMAITDGTAGSGLPRGSRTSIGGRPIIVGELATLEDGTIAGSVLTMDRAFAKLVTEMGLSLIDAATICSTTPARALGLEGMGSIRVGAIADLVVLNRALEVVRTFIAGQSVTG
ncbi:MAG: N-acetylglucosamine-6-phosphate deacetylase [Acidobacteriota bacterium]